jgi:hypothetical protein
MNSGREYRVGPYLVDGYDPDTKEIYEFLGDWYHSCPCLGGRDEKQIANYNKTIARLDYIRCHNYKINVIWECEHRKELRENFVLTNISLYF